MVKVKAIKDFFDMDNMKNVKEGDSFEVTEKRLKQLIEKGVVKKTPSKAKKD